VARRTAARFFSTDRPRCRSKFQPKLLPAAAGAGYERVGEARPRKASVRVIAATNRDLAAE